MTEAAARLRKPVLRPPEKHQLGYNNILLPQYQVATEDVIGEAAKLLKLSAENVRELMSQSVPMPVARTASREEAELVSARLQDLGLECLALSDEELGSDSVVKRVRSIMLDDERVTIYQAGAADVTEAAWTDIVLIVPGRLFETRLEIKERKTGKTENEILDTSEFFRDETVIDFYTASNSSTWRVSAAGFDFSCLGREKALVANVNIGKLQRLIVSKAVNAQLDDSYGRMRTLLELAWSTQQETQSSGWRRERPGKLSVGMATTKSNESQFTRYSRLRYLLRSHR
jgi:hypothetical protein